MMLSILPYTKSCSTSTLPYFFSCLHPPPVCHLVTSTHSMTPRPRQLCFRPVPPRYGYISNNTSTVSVSLVHVLPIHLNLSSEKKAEHLSGWTVTGVATLRSATVQRAARSDDSDSPCATAPGDNNPGPSAAALAPLPERIEAFMDPWECTGAAPQGWANHF